MKEPSYKRLVTRATILTGILLTVSGIMVFARASSTLLQVPSGIQDAAAPPYVTIDPQAVDFSEVVVGRRSKPIRIIVRNTGGKPLFIDSVSGEGDQWSDFSLVTDKCTGATVAPQRSCVIDVAFSPSGIEERNAKLTLTDNAPDTPQTVSLTGEGINAIDAPPFAR